MLICYTLASNPYTIVFMAMTHHRLGESAEAESLLAKLRELVASDRWIKTRRVRCADHPVSLNHREFTAGRGRASNTTAIADQPAPKCVAISCDEVADPNVVRSSGPYSAWLLKVGERGREVRSVLKECSVRADLQTERGVAGRCVPS
jgi:hypothetical protein